ncbi:AAA family ATPase [Phanerochaete sordida]|uniref:AAA family ATPase n=1 Tax=Phanerochaete sordida TaxID=48140 RepID=A0A9P3L9U1_9APHY|nr:AAA family ATPase [Phanerochaete sordida]
MSISVRTFIVRLAEAEESFSRAARRIFVHADVLKAAKVVAGDVLALTSSDEKGNERFYSVGVAWPVPDGPAEVVQVSPALLATARLTSGSKVKLYSLSGKVPQWLPTLSKCEEARTVHLREVTESGTHVKSTEASKGKHRDWLPLLLREALVDLKYITWSQLVEVVYEGQTRRFAVQSVSGSSSKSQADPQDLAATLEGLSIDVKPKLCTVGWDTFVTIVDDKAPSEEEKATETKGVESSLPADAYSAVGGLDKQIAQIRDLIEIPLTRPELFRHFGLKPPRGILLHGPPGTGKTHLARAIAASTNSSVIVINGPELSSAYHGETESKIRDVFADARAKSPCIVVLDEVDALCPRREEGPGGEVEKRVVAQLLTIMDGMEEVGKDGKEERVVVVATTNRPNAIDPALRRPGRFDREIEIGVPDADARASIFNVLLAKTPHTLTQDEIRTVASCAHGYVGADLSAVVREAGTSAIKRWLSAHPADASAAATAQLTFDDLAGALLSVRPSALRSVFLDTARVRYADIGGQATAIQKLRECVEWPIRHPEVFARLGVKAPKGVLLYGPPGCSKTMLVRALATESGVNFVAVKGPELLNKYLGESERAVREIFRKARAAAPSIIFFDEVDALGSSRTGSDSNAHEGVLTSLLNEMDGVEELVGVTVVAATNRPDVLDSALMRPGRLDRQVFVGPPDFEGRVEILRIRTQKMSVEPDLNIEDIARLTEGYSGAELAALCQEAAMLTIRENFEAQHVPQSAFVAATTVVKKQITPEVIQRYQNFQQLHES